MPKLSDWEARVAQDEHSPAGMIMMLSDWRAEKSALICRFEEIVQHHEDWMKQLDPRSKKYYYHNTMVVYTRAILLALTAENIYLLRGE